VLRFGSTTLREMAWLLLAAFSGALSMVGFGRGTQAGLVQALPAVTGLVFGLLKFRLTKAPAADGSWVLKAAGGLSLLATAGSTLEVVLWLQTKRSTLALGLLPCATLAFVFLAVGALQRSAGQPKPRSLYALALVSVANAVAAALLMTRQVIEVMK
jgi:hypothetical protein